MNEQTVAPVKQAMTTCGHEAWDGNRDDPSFAYCDLAAAHAGQHRYSVEVEEADA